MIDELINTFERTLKFMEQSVADLSEQQMVQQPTGVPNHAAWTLGHIIYSCQGIAGELGVEEAHTAFHAGQLAVWCRAIGKESVAVFISPNTL